MTCRPRSLLLALNSIVFLVWWLGLPRHPRCLFSLLYLHLHSTNWASAVRTHASMFLQRRQKRLVRGDHEGHVSPTVAMG
ncbi:uncharacterized protein BO97DRAFT_112719 [Aspergillus homomorphus CBS 101889]|uniref:Uncharacterized protein n=1 Tax=Aspergillus homomorphus (strain CBS 101889) TaxID=1450537 RepID=A0A395HXV9_ASPHC|nr:hypothetical protein BO97DRAFT_112719 [Aspergillus homomorphus CBS 101889]RAL11084.1 hypothetical protein BO97DRAFT_112719 [Aspergillus homomorphus CBS 101889]